MSCPLGSLTLKRASGKASMTSASRLIFSSLAMRLTSSAPNARGAAVLTATQEACVVPHQKIGLDALNQIQAYADNDQQSCAAKKAGDKERNLHLMGHN